MLEAKMDVTMLKLTTIHSYLPNGLIDIIFVRLIFAGFYIFILD